MPNFKLDVCVASLVSFLDKKEAFRGHQQKQYTDTYERSV